MRELLIAGAGGFARETAAAVHAINEQVPTWHLLGFLDDNPALHGQSRSGVPILGGLDATIAAHPGAAVVVCVGNPRNYTARKQIVERLALPADRVATIIHPTVAAGAGCTIGPGSVLLSQITLTADVSVGAHVAVMPQTVLTHDDVVHDYATLTSGVRLGGDVTVSEGAYVGAGALIREGVTIGAWAQVGLGAVVLRDVPPGQIWVGNPARFLRSAQLQTV
ncbi:transferase [Rhizocola hellebori]|uniref:Transferase n=1 Tax=Rhizocola hellebori TaxID=1392758 RepID=A0A8J3VLM8_9ACTN|nr:acetyltransferase [Rhizocola hellebori]GIH11005.1 transferase [Rhizocola hellebori]